MMLFLWILLIVGYVLPAIIVWATIRYEYVKGIDTTPMDGSFVLGVLIPVMNLIICCMICSEYLGRKRGLFNWFFLLPKEKDKL